MSVFLMTLTHTNNITQLVYLWALVEDGGLKLDYNVRPHSYPEYSTTYLHIKQKTPRPGGRSVTACETKIKRLTKYLKDDLAALRGGQPVKSGAAKKGATGRKRKGEVDADGEAAQTKRGRKKKSEVEVDEEDWFEGVMDIKAEEQDVVGGFDEV